MAVVFVLTIFLSRLFNNQAAVQLGNEERGDQQLTLNFHNTKPIKTCQFSPFSFKHALRHFYFLIDQHRKSFVTCHALDEVKHFKSCVIIHKAGPTCFFSSCSVELHLTATFQKLGNLSSTYLRLITSYHIHCISLAKRNEYSIVGATLFLYWTHIF